MVSTMLSRAVLLLAALSVALAAEESHIMRVGRHGVSQLPAGLPQMPVAVSMIPMTAEDAAAAAAAQTPADERSLKLLPKAGLLSKFVLKPKFPFGLKDKLPLSLKKKLPVFLGGSAAAAAAGAGAGAAGAGSLGALGIHGLDFGKLGGDAALMHQYPVWKVHRYNGIDLRPVRLGAPAPGGPYPAAAPAPYAFEEPKQVYGPPPKEVAVPEPVYGPPAETYGPPAETYGPPAQTYGPPAETYGPPAETYGPPAQTYGPPAETYGPPAQTYGPPAETYGPPAQTYGPPAETYGPPAQTYGPPAQTYGPPAQTYGPPAQTYGLPAGNAAAPATDTNEGLEALSQLGALTDLLPGGAGASSGALGSLGQLGTLLATSGRSKGEILSTLAKLKEGFPNLIKSAVAPAPAPPAESAVYRPPAPTGIHGLLQSHPLISHITNGFRGGAASHVALPPLPELPTLPEIKGLKEIPGIPALPHIKLPTKYIAQGGPYVSVRYPTHQSAVSPRGQLPIPASAQTYAPAQTFTAPAAAPAQTFTASAPAAPSTSYSIPAPPASVPAVEIPAAPSATMLPPVHPAQTYAEASQVSASVGPDQAIQQVAPAVNPSFTLPLEQPQQQQQQQQQQHQYVYQTVNSYGNPVGQETYTYVSNQQYAAPNLQYSPVTQYATPDAFTSASEPQGATADAEGREQQQPEQSEEEDDERADINPNSRSDHIDAALDGTLDAASENAEVRVAMPSGETHAVSTSQAQPAVSPVFNREEQARRLEKLEEMRHMVNQMVDLTAYLDPAHPASSAPSESSDSSAARAAGSSATQVDAAAAATTPQQSEARPSRA